MKTNLDDEIYEIALNKYLSDGINYGANTIEKSDREDLEQLASDSFFYGAQYAIERYGLNKNTDRLEK